MAVLLTGMKSVMQKEIFEPNDERLLAVISVTKSTGRKKKPSFLAISVLQHDNHPVAILSRIKPVDKKESLGIYKRVKSWPLSDLKQVNCHAEGSELEFKFEKNVFKWVADNIAQKRLFISSLYKTIHRYNDRTNIQFINVDEAKLQELIQSSSKTETRATYFEDTEEILEQEDHRELSAQEEVDLERLLESSGREDAIQDAAALVDNLTEELSQLDQSNIHSLMRSEEQIEQLMEHLEGGIVEIEKMEMQLTVYDELLAGVRETMQKLSFQYSHILRQNANLKSLCDEVNELVTKVDLDPQIETVLREHPLGTRGNIQDCTAAAQMLQIALGQELGMGLSILQAVTDQREFFSVLTSGFGKRLQEHLTAKFVHNASIMTESTQVRHTSCPSLTSHSAIHNDLLMYRDLMKWLKECQPGIFSEVMDSYVRAFRHVYEEQLKGLLKDSRDVLQVVRSSETRKPGFILSKISGSTADVRSPISGSMSSLSPAHNSFMSQSISDFSISPSHSHDSSRGPTFDRLFPLILEQVQPVCVAEQKFLNSFFNFERSEKNHEMENVRESTRLLESSDEKSDINMGTQHLLSQLFADLLPEIEEFINFGEKQDSYNALYLLVYVSQRLLFAEESGAMMSYLDETLQKALLHIRRLFDKFIDEKSKQIQDAKVPRGSKCGVLPCVKVFEEFAERSERIVMATERRTELDKAYQYLIDALFKTVERVALDHPKTPCDVIKFENYNKVVDILSRLKIVCLEKSRDEARKKYRLHKNDYVNNCLGKPLDKLSAFFEGIENLRAGGTKPEEVGFRLEYSRTELKKCIREYPGREVKRGLEKLYRQVEKEVSEGELQVVWGNMQSAFIQQCVKFQELIEECYPGSNVTLDFSVSDLTEYFTSISRSA